MRKIMVAVFVFGLVALVASAGAQPPAQGKSGDALRFKAPDEALAALRAALEARDLPKLRAIFGVEVGELGSGDPVQDQADLEGFAKELAASARLVPDGDDALIVRVGAQAYDFPVPLIRKDNQWYFDADAGKEEMLNRRIGENELRTIAVCNGYVAAQRDYYARDWDGDGVIEYAQRLASTPGKKDGLYWESRPGEPTSPLGPLVAEAQGEGYGGQSATQPAGPRPYHGYCFRILTQQGERAPGGKYGYVINGHMLAGFALVAWPVQWGNSGVMTFLVNTNGRVLQKNLGEKTAEIAAALTEYNPDDTWAPALE